MTWINVIFGELYISLYFLCLDIPTILDLFLCLLWLSHLFVLVQIGGGQNINRMVLKVAEGVINESRELRLQPFNEYRKRFNLKPYTSFSEFTGIILQIILLIKQYQISYWINAFYLNALHNSISLLLWRIILFQL